MPNQPYSSWQWNGNSWLPPISLPDDSEFVNYTWDESTVSWKSDAADPALATKVGADYGAVELFVEE